jgi:hypothetical protein
VSLIGLGALAALFMSLVVCTYAQEPPQDSRPPTQEHANKPREVPPPPREPGVKPPQSQQGAKPPKHPPETKPPKSEKQQVPHASKEQPKPSQKQQRTSTPQSKARPAGKSVHIPDPQFRANFGRPHKFTANRVITTTTVIPNQTQFVYQGYTFIFVDPWPADWLFTDDCYVDYADDEYFLVDILHRGIRVGARGRSDFRIRWGCCTPHLQRISVSR